MITLTRYGDWYEAFGEEQVIALRDVLGIRPIRGPMGYHAGVPYHELDRAVERLRAAGYQVVVKEKQSNPGENLSNRGRSLLGRFQDTEQIVFRDDDTSEGIAELVQRGFLVPPADSWVLSKKGVKTWKAFQRGAKRGEKAKAEQAKFDLQPEKSHPYLNPFFQGGLQVLPEESGMGVADERLLIDIARGNNEFKLPYLTTGTGSMRVKKQQAPEIETLRRLRSLENKGYIILRERREQIRAELVGKGRAWVDRYAPAAGEHLGGYSGRAVAPLREEVIDAQERVMRKAEKEPPPSLGLGWRELSAQALRRAALDDPSVARVTLKDIAKEYREMQRYQNPNYPGREPGVEVRFYKYTGEPRTWMDPVLDHRRRLARGAMVVADPEDIKRAHVPIATRGKGFGWTVQREDLKPVPRVPLRSTPHGYFGQLYLTPKDYAGTRRMLQEIKGITIPGKPLKAMTRGERKAALRAEMAFSGGAFRNPVALSVREQRFVNNFVMSHANDRYWSFNLENDLASYWGLKYIKDRSSHVAAVRTAVQHAMREQARTGSFTPLLEENPFLKIVYNKLLGGWYVVSGKHHVPLNGRFSSKAEAQAWLQRRDNPIRSGTEVKPSDDEEREQIQLLVRHGQATLIGDGWYRVNMSIGTAKRFFKSLPFWSTQVPSFS